MLLQIFQLVADCGSFICLGLIYAAYSLIWQFEFKILDASKTKEN